MKFAMKNGERRTAKPGLTGVCRVCEKPVIAKCGDIRVWHWAHRGNRACDQWWEPETKWHRAWKNLFPTEWQEVVHFDQVGEKHIADVKTPQDLVIEFQHSFLKPEERISREAFYGNMVWIVDGTRLKRDLPRFVDGRSSWRSMGLQNLFVTPYPEGALPSGWLQSTVPVFFDFDGGPEYSNSLLPEQHLLWCLFPKRALDQSVIVAVSRHSFFEQVQQRGRIMDTDGLIEVIAERLQRERAANQLITQRRRSVWPTRYRYQRRRNPRM